MALTLQEDMNDIFLSSGFEEDIEYTPSGGVAKTIKAVVYRQGASETRSGRATSNRYRDIEIDISTDATEGIAKITVKEDAVALYKEIGDTTVSTFFVKGIVHDDAGAKRLAIS
jgi:hypothetical protein